MREIKFRGKRTDNGEWVYGFYWFNVMSKTHWLTLNEWSTQGWNIEVIPETAGQYTGLKDKNGVKIFEGDIVLYERNINSRIDKYKFIIKWLEDKYVLRHENYDIDEDITWEMLEVIGNIHDNPELLWESRLLSLENELRELQEEKK